MIAIPAKKLHTTAVKKNKHRNLSYLLRGLFPFVVGLINGKIESHTEKKGDESCEIGDKLSHCLNC